ncbi:MAG: 50S ribosomal protein L29 [Thermoanaerobaculia bacterium]|nr:50S ribosomal protein L29 [Thermoanaerobaculia bacterium]
MLKASELRELNPDELREKEGELSEQLFTLRLQKVTQGQLDNPAKISEVRRDIARVLTVLREQETAQAEA